MDFDDNTGKRETPIKCIFFAEFDHKAGARITVQAPEKYINNESFLNLYLFFLQKTELRGRQINVDAKGVKIIGFPILIKNKKYVRNELMINLCFVCSTSSSFRTLQYGLIVRQLAVHLTHLEFERDFISSRANEIEILEILTDIRRLLNDNRFCSVDVTDGTVIKLKLDAVKPKPIEVPDQMVPVFVRDNKLINSTRFDLTTKRIFPYIDGYLHVSKIAREADVDISLVKYCIRHLYYYEVIALLPIFLYCNTYVRLPRITLLADSIELQEECLEYVWNGKTEDFPTFRSVFQLYSEMKTGMNMKNLCEKFNPSSSGIDEQNLVRFGLLKGLIRRVEKYPIYLGPKPDSIDKSMKAVYDLIDGNHSYDQICCAIKKGPKFIDECVESDPNIVIFHK